jgi:prolyl-tRNA synthetase
MGLDPSVPLLADHELTAGNNWICGANKAETHLTNLDLSRDCRAVRYADLRYITPGDPCPQCDGAIALHRGIEVGHLFKLGARYSEPMGCTFLDEDGREKVMIMDCYGIGVSRIVAAAIEQNNDADGIRFPPPIAPFEAIVICLDPDKPEFIRAAENVYDHLRSLGLDTLLDDRPDRPGAKFKDADLIGAPMQLVVGAKGVGRGVIEAKDRRSGEKAELPIAAFAGAFAEWRNNVYAGWGSEEGSADVF